MPATLLINARSYETRVALVENGQCVEVYVERPQKGSVAGSVYLGRVVRVLPGMQAAFVDIGLDKAAFLHVDNVLGDSEVVDVLTNEAPQRPHRSSENQHPIQDLLRQGQEIMVQVAKEPLGSKGARLTSHITLPGRHLVYMPTIDHVGVSRRITDEDERGRLRELVTSLRPDGRGFIVRTAGEGEGEKKLEAEMDFLSTLWEAINRRRQNAKAPQLLHHDLSVSLRAVRDLVTNEVDQMVIDSESEYQQVMEFVSTFTPHLVPRLELYQDKEPIFDAWAVETELSRALGRRIWLKSGGYIVIETTEALTTVDVNTGRFVGGYDLEETILKTNLEAVKEIAWQLRLRDVGGLIVIDFIDMERLPHRERVMEKLKKDLASDRARTKVLPMSSLGLVEMTRKRVRQSLTENLKESCPYCKGLGAVKNPTTVCCELFRELEREFQSPGLVSVTARVHPKVAEVLYQEERYSLEELESLLNLTVQVVTDPNLHVEQFVLLPEG